LTLHSPRCVPDYHLGSAHQLQATSVVCRFPRCLQGASNRTFELSSKPPSGEGFKLEEQLKTLLTDLKPDTP
jgi:hypothetical protein